MSKLKKRFATVAGCLMEGIGQNHWGAFVKCTDKLVALRNKAAQPAMDTSALTGKEPGQAGKTKRSDTANGDQDDAGNAGDEGSGKMDQGDVDSSGDASANGGPDSRDSEGGSVGPSAASAALASTSKRKGKVPIDPRKHVHPPVLDVPLSPDELRNCAVDTGAFMLMWWAGDVDPDLKQVQVMCTPECLPLVEVRCSLCLACSRHNVGKTLLRWSRIVRHLPLVKRLAHRIDRACKQAPALLNL